MENLDLCISNYTYEDILDLFKLETNFNEEDLKRAKKYVLMTHPDKSGLDKEYFLFFSSAYRLVYKIYLFRNRSEQDTCVNRKYTANEVDEELENEDVWKKLANHDNFNTIFNQLFEKHKQNTSGGDGYGDWLKEDQDVEVAKNKDDMERIINERKTNLRQLVVHQGVGDMISSGGSSITGKVASYQSGVFSDGLQYDDVKHAYTESVVPVTREDYTSRQQYSSMDEYRRSRRETLQEAVDSADHSTRLKEQKYAEDTDNISRAYDLAKADEETRRQRIEMASSLLKITDGTR